MRKVLNAIETVISLLLHVPVVLFVAWLNGKQKEFDNLNK